MIPRHITVKLLKLKDKEKMFKATRGEKNDTLHILNNKGIATSFSLGEKKRQKTIE